MTSHRLAVPALVTAAAFAAMSAVTFADPGPAASQPERFSMPDAPLPVGKILPANGGIPVPVPALPPESLATPSTAPSTAAPTAEPHAKRHHKAKDRKNKRPRKSTLRRGLDSVVPGLDKLPEWSLPIVYKANEDKAPNTTVRVRVDKHGNVIIRAKMIKAVALRKGVRGVSLRTGGPDSVNVRIVVQDPTEATKDAPTSITVTATDPVTASTVTTTAEVTAPAEVTTVTETAVTATVQEAADTTELGTPT